MSWSLFSSGVAPKAWAISVLKAGGWPTTPANEQSLIAWAAAEGGGGTMNPLNTSQHAAGSTTFNSAGVQNFTSWTTSIPATVKTINNGFYPNIVSDLKSGKGITSNASADLAKWGTGSFSAAISNTWSRAATYMGGSSTPLPTGGTTTQATTTSSVSPGGVGGLLSIPSEITDFFRAANQFAKGLLWLTKPANWLRIVAFLAGVVLLMLAIRAFILVGDGRSPFETPQVMPVPV